MISNKTILIGISVAAIAILAFQFFSQEDPTLPRIEASPDTTLSQLPDFSTFKDVKEKKEAFFTTLYPIIEEENKQIIKVRNAIINLQALPFESLEPKQLAWIEKVRDYYKVDNESVSQDTFTDLLKRVDVIPPSLALTQAAIESGWGSSRFSRQGNNLFGQWCFTKGCGMVPSARDDDKAHEVAEFGSVNKSVRAYLKNLNTHSAYQTLRDKRAAIRNDSKKLTGISLAQTLTEYSEEREKYIAKVSRFINQNKLQRFTQQFEQSLVAEATIVR